MSGTDLTVLVTGAAGFLGTPVSEKLKKAGYQVITTDRAGNPDILGDLSDRGFTESLPPVNIVVHCAAVQYVSSDLPFFRRKAYFKRNNILATENLVQRYRNKLSYFLQIGTSMMYDQTGLSEYATDAPQKGVGVYSKSKLAAVRIAQTIGAPLGIMVPCIIGGPGREGLFRNFVTTIAKFGFAIRPGSGKFLTHMVHVDDAADLAVLLVEQEATGIYNAAGPEPLSIIQWIHSIQDELGVKRVRIIPIPYSLIAFGAWLTRYRIIAKEQALMLGQSHVLSIEGSLSKGWAPAHSNERIARDIANYVANSS